MEELPADASWHAWFQRFGPRLLLCARQWTSCASDAEDIVQDAFVRYWRRQRALGGDALPLLLTSIRRAAFDLARRKGRITRREEAAAREAAAESEGPRWFAAASDGDDRRAALESALAELPTEQREVVVLRIWGELSFDAIARQLSIPLQTAASRYRYGLIAMRRTLAPAVRHE